MRYVSYGYRWETLPASEFVFKGDRDAALDRMRRILSEWEDTPYLAGRQVKKAGVDCVRFVCAVLDELYGINRDVKTVLNLPQDVSLHDRAGAFSAMRAIKELYGHDDVEGLVVQPGDVFVVGETTGGPGHAIFVGPDENTLWQAGSRKVHKTGLAFVQDAQRVFRVYRPRERRKWAAA